MNTIVDLLRYRNDLINHLGSLTTKIDVSEPLISLANLNSIHTNVSFSTEHIRNSFFALQEQIQEKNISVVNEIKKLIVDVENQIDILGQSQTFETDVDIDDTGQNLIGEIYQRPKLANSFLPDSVISRCRRYSTWQYPGLIISPIDKFWIDTMVACDPLYLLGMSYRSSHIEEIISVYPIEYQRRLRIYKNLHDKNFSKLPNNQFGFILAWEVMLEFSIQSIEKYLTLILNLLRPGGVFMFNYNECDHLELAESSEKKAIPYCNSRILKNVCETIGYNIIQFGEYKSEDANNYLNWIEIKKPGEITTVKRAQASGSVLLK